MNNHLEVLNQVSIRWETARNEKNEVLVSFFIMNLMMNNDMEILKGLNFIVREKEVHIKTNYHYSQENGLANLLLVGAKYNTKPAFRKDRIITQPIYYTTGGVNTKRNLVGKLKLTVNFLREELI